MSGLEHASQPSQRALLRVLTERRVILEGLSEPEGTSRRQSQGRLTIDEENSRGEGGVWNLPHPFTIVYVCAFDPKERPKIHKTLVRLPSSTPFECGANSVLSSSTSLQ
jgi:hypothetical protein